MRHAGVQRAASVRRHHRPDQCATGCTAAAPTAPSPAPASSPTCNLTTGACDFSVPTVNTCECQAAPPTARAAPVDLPEARHLRARHLHLHRQRPPAAAATPTATATRRPRATATGTNKCGCTAGQDLLRSSGPSGCVTGTECCQNSDCGAGNTCSDGTCVCNGGEQHCPGLGCIAATGCCTTADCDGTATCNGSHVCTCGAAGTHYCAGTGCITATQCCTAADCGAHTDATAACTANACGYTCNGGFHDCSGTLQGRHERRQLRHRSCSPCATGNACQRRPAAPARAASPAPARRPAATHASDCTPANACQQATRVHGEHVRLRLDRRQRLLQHRPPTARRRPIRCLEATCVANQCADLAGEPAARSTPRVARRSRRRRTTSPGRPDQAAEPLAVGRRRLRLSPARRCAPATSARARPRARRRSRLLARLLAPPPPRMRRHSPPSPSPRSCRSRRRAARAQARSTAFDAAGFHPSATSQGLLRRRRRLRRAAPRLLGRPVATYGARSARRCAPPIGALAGELIVRQLGMDLVGSFAILDRLELGIDLPFVPYQATTARYRRAAESRRRRRRRSRASSSKASCGRRAGTRGASASPASPARRSPPATRTASWARAASSAASASSPSGSRATSLGSINAGFLVRGGRDFGDLHVGSQFQYGVGAGRAGPLGFAIVGEVRGARRRRAAQGLRRCRRPRRRPSSPPACAGARASASSSSRRRRRPVARLRHARSRARHLRHQVHDAAA